MNQKNIFTGISVVLIIQGIAFFATKEQLATSTFPSLDAAGLTAIGTTLEVISVISILVGLIAYAGRELPQLIWAFSVGFILFLIVTLKHMFVDNVNVPIFAVIIQVIIVLSCLYLWMQSKKQMAMSI